jgi:hypothetical protein
VIDNAFMLEGSSSTFLDINSRNHNSIKRADEIDRFCLWQDIAKLEGPGLAYLIYMNAVIETYPLEYRI